MAHHPRPAFVLVLRVIGWLVILVSCIFFGLFAAAFGDVQNIILNLGTAYKPFFLVAFIGGVLLIEALGFTLGLTFLYFARVIAELSEIRLSLREYRD